jgi:small-conductance mechanosensitive channel
MLSQVRVLLFLLLLLGPFYGIEATTLWAQDTTGTPIEAVPADSTDHVLETRLEGIYQQVEAFRDIGVSVQKGVVHLDGTVLQPQKAGEAEELARSLEGVVYVENDISAQTDIADRVSPAVSRLKEFGTGFFDFLPVVIIALFVVFVTIIVARWIGQWEISGAVRMSSPAWGLVRRAIQFVVALIGLVIVFDLLGVTSLVGALLGTAGVAGLAVGFAFRDIIENYLAGILLSLRQPFRVNDVVSVAEQEGRVVRLTAREVVLLTFDGNHVRLPNAMVFKSVLVNYTLNAQRLFCVDVGVGNDEDLTEVQRVGIETLDAMKGVMGEPPPFARVRELGDSSVIVRFHGWVDQEEVDFHKVESEAVRLLKQAFDEADVEMPEPTYQLQLYEAGKAPPHAPKGPGSPVVDQAATVDVERDDHLEQKVEEDLRTSEEENLLSR